MFIADFHIHSRYSRATSRECIPEVLHYWACRKGIALIGTGDFTHPAWRGELKEKLTPLGDGLYGLKPELRLAAAGPNCGTPLPRFIITGEISSIYKKNGRVRKVHNLILLPSLEAAEALALRLESVGNLHSDGRPILGLDSRDLLEITLETAPGAMLIPAHIWTPHFSLFGAYSGFDHIKECFEDLTPFIYALETGLSSDPPMNQRLSMLDSYAMVSNSDAHSPGNLGREANLFNTELSYPAVTRALRENDMDAFYGTIEFYPEEGKYHYDGHRACSVCFKPSQTRSAGGVCPVCGSRITVGVLNRVEALADRAEGYMPNKARHFESLAPLTEVIAASTGLSAKSVRVRAQYDGLVDNIGPEFHILREAPLEIISRQAGPCITEGIRRLREGKVALTPGYDGVYGKIKILDKDEIEKLTGQVAFFSGARQPVEKVHKGGKTLKDAHMLEKDALKLEAGPIPLPLPTPRYSANKTIDLSEEQAQAVTIRDAAASVIAGPGSGKTRTLVERIAYLVKNARVPPTKITAVTFTNQAAAEMRERLETRFEDKKTVKAMTIGTFHSICLKLLKDARPGEFTVLDETGAAQVINDVIGQTRSKASPRAAMRAISLIKNGAKQEHTDDPDEMSELYFHYQARLKEMKALDFDDILLEALRLYKDEDVAAVRFARRVSCLLADEFQDLNDTQYRLFQEWARHASSVFIIGDPDQAIYGFRGAYPDCFDRFYMDFPNAREIRLSKNFRSTPQIIECALPVISRLPGKERAYTSAKQGGCMPRLIKAPDAFSEALFIVKEINRLIGGADMLDAHLSPAGGRRPRRGLADIAVLYRTHRQAALLEECLQKEGIPYQASGREDYLLDPQVQRTLSFFRFALNKTSAAAYSLCMRLFGVPEEMCRREAEQYPNAQVDPDYFRRLAQQQEHSALGRLAALALHYLPRAAKEKPLKLLESYAADTGAAGPCMDKLFRAALLHKSTAAFLQTLAIGVEGDIVRSSSKRYTPDSVSLMTLHGSKGLEFPVVFLCGLRQGLVPFVREGAACDIDEERRLFYVGMTRAADELYMTSVPPASAFLADVPPESVQTEEAYARGRADAKQLSFLLGSKPKKS